MSLIGLVTKELLRPKAQRLSVALAVWGLVVIFSLIALGFLVAGVFLLLAEPMGAGGAALVTGGILVLLALCLIAGLEVARRKAAKQHNPELALLLLAGLIAGLAGIGGEKPEKTGKPEADS
ncbi:MAG: hypothetical protein LJE62_04450 [Silicimonas sp.]|jgi:hypothetical protein|nr:hypothetical protein [Silicimonas sp.]